MIFGAISRDAVVINKLLCVFEGELHWGRRRLHSGAFEFGSHCV